MLRLCVLFFLFVSLACGGQKDDTNKTNPSDAASKAEPTPEKASPELLQRVWAPSGKDANNETTRTLLSFHPDGSYGYYAFDGQKWNNTPGTYKLDGQTLTDNENQTYQVTVTKDKLSLDNQEEGKTDFIDWHPATVADWDPVEKKAPSPVKAP